MCVCLCVYLSVCLAVYPHKRLVHESDRDLKCQIFLKIKFGTWVRHVIAKTRLELQWPPFISFFGLGITASLSYCVSMYFIY